MIWIFKNYILSRRKCKEVRKTQRLTLELFVLLILLKIYIIRAIFFTQLIKNLKIELFIVIIIDIKKTLRGKLYSNPTIFLFKKY